MDQKLFLKVQETIENYDLIRPGDSIVVGFSGGPDSVCLLHVLYRMKKDWQIEIHAVHMNHCLRPFYADEDEEYARKFCEFYEIPFHAFRKDVELLSKERKITTEEAGRQVRYEAFEEIRNSLGRDAKIAVAHNLNDQGETVLMRLIRGTGPDGLAAMDYERQGNIIRPLLDVTRDEIEEYCKILDLKPQIDLSNLEPMYVRNKIRLELMPLLEKEYNSNILASLIRLSTIVREDRDFFKQKLEEIKSQTFKKTNILTGELDRVKYRKLHPSLGKRLIYDSLKEIGMDRDITAFHLDRADLMIRNGNVGDQMDFPLNFAMTLTYDKVGIYEKSEEKEINKKTETSFSYPLIIEGTTELKEISLSIKSTLISAEEAREIPAKESRNKMALLDFHQIENPEELKIRTRQPGDLINPLGMKGRKKVQDYFVDRKIPKDKRDGMPMLCLENEVIWIPNLGLSEKHKMKEENTQILFLEIFESS